MLYWKIIISIMDKTNEAFSDIVNILTLSELQV